MILGTVLDGMWHCPDKHTEEASVLIKKNMELVLPSDAKRKYDVPLTVDINCLRNWGEEYEEEKV